MDLLTRVRAEKRAEGEQRHVILDGKTLCGTKRHLAEDQKPMHHVNLYEAKTGVVLKEQMVAEKEGELTQVKEFLTPLLLKGRILSADALYTQKSVCQEVIAAGGEYLLFVKGNQPTLQEDLRFFFKNPLWIALIGERRRRRTKVMGASRPVSSKPQPNSMTS